MSRPSSARVAALGCAALAACASAPPATRTLEGAAEVLAARGVEETLASLEWSASTLSLPPAEARSSPSMPGYWLARAVAFAPDVRAARRAWREVRAARVGAGAPEPVFLQAMDHAFSGSDPLFEAIAVFDVLGLAKLGPAAREVDAARALEAQRLGELERAAWRAWLEVERARVRTAFAARRRAETAQLAADAELDLARIEILERTGRIGAAAARSAEGAALSVVRRATLGADAASDAAAELSILSGLANAGAVADACAFPEPLAQEPGADPAELGASHPELRALALAFEARDAEVRLAAAGSWPMIGLGPHLGFPDGPGGSRSRVGGALRMRLPFPSEWRSAIDAAVERREAAIDAYEDRLFALNEHGRHAARRLERARRRLTESSAPLDAATDAAWTATRAAFRTGRADVAVWRSALLARADAIDARLADEQSRALAGLHLIEASGPLATPFASSRGAAPDEGEGRARLEVMP
ncbi:MAG: TolC family protein [Planctomycetota bacterium]